MDKGFVTHPYYFDKLKGSKVEELKRTDVAPDAPSTLQPFNLGHDQDRGFEAARAYSAARARLRSPMALANSRWMLATRSVWPFAGKRA